MESNCCVCNAIRVCKGDLRPYDDYVIMPYCPLVVVGTGDFISDWKKFCRWLPKLTKFPFHFHSSGIRVCWCCACDACLPAQLWCHVVLQFHHKYCSALLHEFISNLCYLHSIVMSFTCVWSFMLTDAWHERLWHASTQFYFGLVMFLEFLSDMTSYLNFVTSSRRV